MDYGKKRLCVLTGTRADWGLLSPVARALSQSGRIKVDIIATNMHLMPQYGDTWREIEADGFDIAARVPVDAEGDDDASKAKIMAQTLAGMADAFDRLRPDAVLILGDRYEMLAAASAAAVMHLPIIHIAGGEITEGALDDSFRHAITKLSSLHLTATEDYRRRVIQLGEQPDMVVNTGAIGVWNAMNTPLMTAAELSESIGFDVTEGPLAVVTYHPATNDSVSPRERLEDFLAALDRHQALKLVVTAPNNDAGGAGLLTLLEEFAAARRDRVCFVRSLGMVRYHSLLRCANLVIGNSSSGIVEVPSAGIPTVDVGIRQRGRIASRSVIHCDEGRDSIDAAISKALSEEMQTLAKRCENPYYKADTCQIMMSEIENFMGLPKAPKQFHDII